MNEILADAYRTLGGLKADCILRRAQALADSAAQGHDVWQTRHFVERVTGDIEAEIVILEHEILALKEEQ